MFDIWKQKRRLRKGFIKIHCSSRHKDKEDIISMSVTKENVHDGERC